MKKIFVSQRVDIVESYGERRDALDQRFSGMLHSLGGMCIPLPNDSAIIRELWLQIIPDAVILSGGNTSIQYGGNAPERDMADKALIELCAINKTPLLGICRGMQSIIEHFGGTLERKDGHVKVRHNLLGDFSHNVNSYHNFVPKELPGCIIALSHAEDGSIEHIRHSDLPIFGIMWHPEREDPVCPEQMKQVKEILCL